MAFRPRPQKENRRSRLVIGEISLGIISILFFGKEIWLLVLWLFDWIFNADSLPYSAATGIEITEAWLTVLVILLTMFLAMVLATVLISRRGAYPIRNADEIAAKLPKDDSFSLTNPINKPEAQVTNEKGFNLAPVPPSITFNYPYLRETIWDWIFPRENTPEITSNENYGMEIDNFEYDQLYGQTVFENWSERLKDSYFAFFHQLRWLFGLRGYNAVIQKGKVISTDTGKNYAATRGFVISDFDGTYLLDASQNGQRTGIPPQVGWFGMQRTRRTKVLESTLLGRISRFDKNVSATTSDGIEIIADISAVFTLGLRPISVYVALNGEKTKPEDQVISVKMNQNDDDFTFEIDTTKLLDEQDRRVIAQQADKLRKIYSQQRYQRPLSSFNFEFDPQRVVRALTSKPITKDGDPVEWRDIVLQYSKDVFQRVIQNRTFDQLYGDVTDYDSNRYPIDDLMQEMQWTVQRDGLLNYRLLWAKNEDNFAPVITNKDDNTTAHISYTEENIGNAPTSPPQSPTAYRMFNNAEALPDTPYLDGFDTKQKFLRARGIRVIAAQFDNVRPKLPEIDDARAYVWTASLTKETDEIRGEIEKQYAKILNQAIADTQETVIDNLLSILNSGAAEDVALLEFLTALEEIANRDDPESIIPRDFLNFIAEVRHWLNP